MVYSVLHTLVKAYQVSNILGLSVCPVICVSFRRHLGSQLCEMERLIDKMMVADFSTYAQSDLNRPFEEDIQVMEKVRPSSFHEESNVALFPEITVLWQLTLSPKAQNFLLS